MRSEIKCDCKGGNQWTAFADQIRQAIAVIGSIDDLTYRKRANGTGSVGEQFRHNLDFVNSFLNGIAIGRIDYSNRERDARIERDRLYAIRRFESLLTRVNTVPVEMLNKVVSVLSETDASTWLTSSVGREFDFVFSHTVHHHALIMEKLAGFGFRFDATFGVSPSTIEYRSRIAA